MMTLILLLKISALIIIIISMIINPDDVKKMIVENEKWEEEYSTNMSNYHVELKALLSSSSIEMI